MMDDQIKTLVLGPLRAALLRKLQGPIFTSKRKRGTKWQQKQQYETPVIRLNQYRRQRQKPVTPAL